MVQWKRGTMACRGQYFRGAGVKLQSPSSAIQNPKTCTKQNQGLRLRLPPYFVCYEFNGGGRLA